MARILEVREVCERALRRIGSYSIRDSQADAAEMAEARHWLDMLMGHVAARRRTWWLVAETASVTLTIDEPDYVLSAVLPDGDAMSSVISVTAVNLETDARDPLEVWRRWEWEERDATLVTGPPRAVYIDRSSTPTMRVWPTPSDPLTHRLDVVFQRVSPNLVTGAASERITAFREQWNLYIVTALAAQIGNGPVRKLPQDEVREMQGQAESLLFDLECFDAHEQAGEPRLIAFNEF